MNSLTGIFQHHLKSPFVPQCIGSSPPLSSLKSPLLHVLNTCTQTPVNMFSNSSSFGGLKKLYSQYLLICIVYYLLRYTASGAVLQKKCSRICGLNPRLIYLELINIYMQVMEHFFHNSCLTKHNK